MQTYTVQTNESSHPTCPEWVDRASFPSKAEAKAYIEDQCFAEGIRGEREYTTFGLNGVRIV